MLMHVRSAANC